MTEWLLNNIQNVCGRIKKAAERSGRNLEDITLIAVTKTIAPALINAALDYDIINMGENKVQELMEKQKNTKHGIIWHFIGQLQRNKVKYIIGNVSLIHSLDRIGLAEEIQNESKKANIITPVLVQVNIADEITKGGLKVQEVEELLNRTAEMPNLLIRGLMAVPPVSYDPEDVRPWLRRMKELRDELAEKRIPNILLNELSMGMSGDYEVAIEEGATIVRIGTAIFGKR